MVYQVLNLYAIRMAGVFMITLGTIWLRTGVMRRALAVLTYVLALVLLLSIGLSIWVVLIFPAWVLLVSVIVLVRSFTIGSKGVPWRREPTDPLEKSDVGKRYSSGSAG